MVKLTYSSDISDSVGVGGEIVKSASELKKQASTIFGREYEEMKPPKGKTGIHLVALGDMETYGFNRNADGFKQADCRDRCDTFVKHGHVFQHHRNKDPEKAIGEIKCAAYNPDMHRVELYIWADNEKAHDHLERLEKTGEAAFSMACVRAGTPITTFDGQKPVEQIEKGDFVLTHLGNWREVTATVKHRAPNYCKVRFTSWGKRVLEITPNHRVLAVSFDDIPRGMRSDHAEHPDKNWKLRHRASLSSYAKWIEAGKLTVNHYMCVPLNFITGSGIDTRMARLFGYYMAEGSICGKKGNPTTEFTCNKDDCFVDELEKLADWTSVTKTPKRNSDKAVSVRCYGKKIAEILINLCGRCCRTGKRIPATVMLGSVECKFNYAAAWFNGDGWQDKTGMHWSTCSENLSIQLQQLLAAIAIPSSCTKIDHPEDRGLVKSKDAVVYVVTVSNAYSELFEGISKAKTIAIDGASKARTFISGNYLMVPVSGVELVDEETDVYNFSVTGDESYTVYGLAVHNCRVPSDTCSLCGATRKGPGDPKECDHIKYELGKVAEDGRFIGMVNNEPDWFDISFVGRPADRIAWSLKTASGLNDSVKQAEYEGVVVPDSLAVESESGLRKLALAKDLAGMTERMTGWLKCASCKTTAERRLFEMRKMAALQPSDAVLNGLREYSPRDAFGALADAGVVLDAPSFFKYAMGPDYKAVAPYIPEVEKIASSVISDAVHTGRCAGLCNSSEFDPYGEHDLRRRNISPVLREKLAECGCDDTSRKILDITLSGNSPKFDIDGTRGKGVLSTVSVKLAEKYAAYKLAAIDAVLNSRYGINRNKDNLAAIAAAQDLKQGE